MFFTVAITVERSGFVVGQDGGTPVVAEAPPPAPVDQTIVHQQQNEPVQPDEAQWVGDELLPPLPRDPEKRATAIAKAHSNADKSAGRPPDAQYQATPELVEIAPRTVSTYDIPSKAGQPFSSSGRDQEGTYNLKLPDVFHPTIEELRAAGPDVVEDDAAVEALASSLIQDFAGIDQTNLSPPDCDISVGPNHVVAVVNSRFAFYDKCGTNTYEQNFADYLGYTEFLFDPKVIYDVWDGRWIMTICRRDNTTHDSWVTLMISDDSDPNGSWCTYNVPYGSTYWADYQDVGTDPDAVYITVNMFDWSSPTRFFQYAQIYQLEKATLLTCSATSTRTWTSMTNPKDGTLAFSLRASDMNSYGSDYWMINSVSYGGNFLTLWSISGSWAAPVLSSWNMDVDTYDDPPPLEQPNGTYVDCGDARLLNSAYYNSGLWAGHGRRHNSGGTDYSRITVFQVNTSTKAVNYQVAYGSDGLYYAYPAVDFDRNTLDGIVCFSWGGPSNYPGTRYTNLPSGGPFAGSSQLVAGLANYAGGGTPGTAANPYRWGDYYGCDVDPVDWQSLWFYGQFASNSPTPSWDTHIGMSSIHGPGVLGVTPTADFVSTGLQFGPFTPPSVTYTIANTGGTAFPWFLTGLAGWLTPSSISGQVLPGGTQNVTLTINSNANALSPSTYIEGYAFQNCYDYSYATRFTELTVGIDGSCPGSIVDLTPASPPTNIAGDDNQERGVYVTAIKDFEVCAVGWKADLVLPQTLTARIYEASGTTRGALVAIGTLTAVQPGDVVHYIPISYDLSACQDYDITVQFSTTNSWDYYSEPTITEPFDAGGVIRVRDGEYAGGAGNSALPVYSIIGSEVVCDEVADLTPPTTPSLYAGSNDQRGIFVRPQKTISLCSFGWYADLVIPQVMTARVYEATGKIRGAVIAEATWEVTAGGMRWHDIPINATLLEGNDYNISLDWGPVNDWPWWDERPHYPYSVAPFDSIDGEQGGNATNWAILQWRVGYAEPVGGAPFDLAKLTGSIPPPNSTAQDNHDYGAYVTSLIDQEVYSVGWEADVPAGAAIGARVWEAIGTSRGTLISEGWILSSGNGMRWHDVPVAASLVSGADYDIEIDITQVDQWRAWNDGVGLPYDSYGVMRVRDGEQGGSASNGWLLHMRYNGCGSTLTAVEDDKPQRVPMYLAAPAPNPVTTSARFAFGLEEAGAVTMTVYDVKGRRVATILNGERRPAGPNAVEFNARDLASGVYFVKMSANLKSLTRKIVVTH
jgi:hypothetical protein